MANARQSTADFKGDQISVKMFGVKDNANFGTDGAISSGSQVFNSPSAPFKPIDIGKAFIAQGAGVAGADLVTTIQAFTDPSNIILTDAASTSIVNFNFWYGTNITSALQTAINANQFVGELFLTKGLYLCLGNLVLRDGIHIRGKGLNDSVIYLGPGASITGPPTSNIKHVKLSKFAIVRAGAESGTGLTLQGIWNSMIDMVLFQDFATGLYMNGITQGCYFNEVSMCRFISCATGLALNGGGGQGANRNTIRDNRFEDCGTGILGNLGTNICQGNRIEGNDIEDMRSPLGIGINYSGDNSLIANNWVESVAHPGDTFTGIKLRGVANILVNNKYGMVASGGTVTQLDRDETLINSYLETSTGGEPIFDFTGGVNGQIMRLISISGPPRLRFWRQDVAISGQKMVELGISGVLSGQHKFYIARLDDSGMTVDVPLFIDLGGNNDIEATGALFLSGTTSFMAMGHGNPEGSITANPGSLWTDVDGGGVYWKTTGTGNTGWLRLDDFFFKTANGIRTDSPIGIGIDPDASSGLDVNALAKFLSSINLPSLTASRPLKLDSSKTAITGQISVTDPADITATGLGGANKFLYWNVDRIAEAQITESQISGLSADLSSILSRLTSLETRMTTAEGNISGLTTGKAGHGTYGFTDSAGDTGSVTI